jgi:hypothetical protein
MAGTLLTVSLVITIVNLLNGRGCRKVESGEDQRPISDQVRARLPSLPSIQHVKTPFI